MDVKVQFEMKIIEIIQENKLLDQPTPSIEQIAQKHSVSVGYIKKQLELGIKVEQEHTSNVRVAREIASDHLAERPDYYQRLKKVEQDR